MTGVLNMSQEHTMKVNDIAYLKNGFLVMVVYVGEDYVRVINMDGSQPYRVHRDDFKQPYTIIPPAAIIDIWN
jgi:hypothetical protein